ncbi:MAG: RluA family pseudouridine synthase [Actinomycetota bacterium]|nr:RluA family pseudouridine synthase [Actinomycetota bacterium]
MAEAAIVPASLAGERIDRVVALVYDLSRSVAASLVEQGDVSIGGAPCTVRSTRVAAGDEVAVRAIPATETAPAAEASMELAVVYEDDDVVVIDKPAGLVVHPGAGHPDGTLVNGLLARYPELADVGDPARPGIVHRLDVGTSGLMVVARSGLAYERLVAALKERTSIERRYLALVRGTVEAPRGLVDAAIGRSRREPTRMVVAADGKAARTGYEVRKRFVEPMEASLLECRLETGRTHQIRVHLSSIGHPVVGDTRYGGAARAGEPDPGRPWLHATSLRLAHPRSGELLELASPPPADLGAVLAALR